MAIEHIHIEDENVISLRTAAFDDDGIIGVLHLCPRSEKTRDDSHLYKSFCWVYKRRSKLVFKLSRQYRNHKLKHIFSQLREMAIPLSPDIRFLWSEDGMSVAVLIDGEPLGCFIETKFHGYSKSVLPGSALGNAWDEELFKTVFNK